MINVRMKMSELSRTRVIFSSLLIKVIKYMGMGFYSIYSFSNFALCHALTQLFHLTCLGDVDDCYHNAYSIHELSLRNLKSRESAPSRRKTFHKSSVGLYFNLHGSCFFAKQSTTFTFIDLTISNRITLMLAS